MTDNVASGHRDVAIRFEAVRFVVPAQNATAPPETFCNLEAMKLLLGHIIYIYIYILGPIRCFLEAR